MANGSQLRLNPTPADVEEAGINIPFGADTGTIESVQGRADEADAQRELEAEEELAAEQAKNQAKLAAQKEQAFAKAAQDQVDVVTGEILGGSKEPAVVTVSEEEGHTLDLNPQNQPESEGRRDTLFQDALEANKSNTADLRLLLQEDRDKEDGRIGEMQERLKQLRNRETGLDLSPLAALIDDPNKAKILAQGLSPAFSEEEKQLQLQGLQDKLNDRKDRFSQSRKAMAIKIKELDQRADSDIIRLQSAEAGRREAAKQRLDFRNEKARKDFEKDRGVTLERNMKNFKTEIKAQRASLETMSSLLAQINDPDNYVIDPDTGQRVMINSMAAALAKAQVARIANGPGVLTDRDLSRLSGSLQIFDSLERAIQTRGTTGVSLSPRDQEELAKLVSASIRGLDESIDKKADNKADEIVQFHGSRINVTKDDLRGEDGPLHRRRFVSSAVLKSAEELKSGITGKGPTDIRTNLLSKTPEERAALKEKLLKKQAQRAP